MKKFINTLTLFSLSALIIIVLCEIFIPVTVFFYRPWEAISFSKIPANAPFYTNATLTMNSVGDLCHHTENSIIKNESWKTDELGFRNDNYIKSADILIIGDSYIAGSGLTQTNTISNQVMKMDDNLKVYNMAPSSFSQFDKLVKLGRIHKPKQIIFSIAERNIPSEIKYYIPHSKKETIQNILNYNGLNAYIDKIIKVYPLKWIKARAKNAKGIGTEGINDSKMYFFQGSNQKHEEEDLINTVNTLISYKEYCDSLGIEFLFLPMPDKETVYYELVPFSEQPNYLFQLDSLLKSNGVSTINTLRIYNDYRRENDNLLYHLDDTHWNSNATELISKEIVRLVNQNE
ncbi:MAG: hypothetical protein WCV86_04100 [Patescibacteria group bacterium]|jgi:hypothetical protein